MQRNFYTDDFEQLIRQKADQYKMYPSDHVWKGVHNALHTRRRWYWAGMAILLMGAGIFSADYFMYKQPVNAVATKQQPLLTASHDANKSSQQSSFAPTPTLASRSNAVAARVAGDRRNLSISGLTGASITFREEAATDALSVTDNLQIMKKEVQSELPITESGLSFRAPFALTPEYADAASESSQASQQVNWLQEYAVYQLTSNNPKRIGWMLYFSPTVNYRKLAGSSTEYSPISEVQSVPLALSFNGAVDQYVHHKPALGFELGNSFMYRASKHINFKAGLQFNYSRYNIEAYSTHPEKATIALDPYWNADTIVSYTSVRNMSGNAQQEIANQYFELSLPVGVEVRLFGNEKIQLNVAGTVQPTYLLNRNSYLITTDYKNYTREPSLVRRWNLNAGVETYVAYNTGTVRWQLGPQFRYQILSTYQDKYPIKEYLMEYGFKIGVSKTIR